MRSYIIFTLIYFYMQFMHLHLFQKFYFVFFFVVYKQTNKQS